MILAMVSYIITLFLIYLIFYFMADLGISDLTEENTPVRK